MFSKISMFFMGAMLTWCNGQVLTHEDNARIIDLMLPVISECSVEFPIKDGDIVAAAQSGHFSKIDSCFLACVLKKIGMIDGNGMLDRNKVLEILENNSLSGAYIAKSKEVLDTCIVANDKPVSDGAKGCDRTKMLVECFTPFREAFFA